VTLYDEDVELYDIAFDWDVGDEVTWLLERLGAECRSVLEPGSGSGRMLEAFARRGVEIVGIDISASMVEFARERLARAGVGVEVVHADMTDFDLGRTFDGAICPINTLGHLDAAALARHLACVARHLAPGAKYVVQVGLAAPDDEPGGSHWEAQRNGVRLKIDWEGVRRDFVEGREEQRARITFLSGPRRGEVLEEFYELTIWTPETWAAALSRSPFVQGATYDGNDRDRRRVDSTSTGGLLWHELLRR
jgi:SAM-dependent methyltransferase